MRSPRLYELRSGGSVVGFVRLGRRGAWYFAPCGRCGSGKRFPTPQAAIPRAIPSPELIAR